MLRCGRIKYTNDLPIYAAFDAGAIAYPGTLHADVPARLNAMLLRGELDMSPDQRVRMGGELRELVLLPDLCIGARDEVVSVVLVSRTPPALLGGAPIYVTRGVGERAILAAHHPRAALSAFAPHTSTRAIRSRERARANRRC